MNILSIQNVVKKYSKHTAVDSISLDIKKGSIYGLLGPNGAGKTSLIRIITGITGADEGKILIDGEKLSKIHPTLIGYMPEERGLYKKMKVGDHLMYLAQLKGLSEKIARQKLMVWLEKFEIKDWWNKKVEELSKGMQQKAQFIATVVHDPKLVILDEPFSGLDPINSNLIKDEIYQMNKNGTSIIFSTHRMEQVEEICEDIALINRGKVILEGPVKGLKEKFKEHKYFLEFEGKLPEDINHSGFEILEDTDSHLIIRIKEGHKSNEFLKSIIEKNIEIKTYKEILPSLNEIFIKKVGESNA